MSLRKPHCAHCTAKCSRHPDVFRGKVFCPHCYTAIVDIVSLVGRISVPDPTDRKAV